ncbi:hypothetical protein A2U01_0069954, partial [Trifolium medium]|nr:hypothetical protein [Trifolium medium]
VGTSCTTSVYRVPELQLASEQAPCSVLGELQWKYFLAIWTREDLSTDHHFWMVPTMTTGNRAW